MTRTHLSSRPGTDISWPQSSGTSFQPSSRAAAAGNSAVRSGFVVKKIALMSSTCTELRSTISRRSWIVAPTIASRSFADAVMAPRMPRTAMVWAVSFCGRQVRPFSDSASFQTGAKPFERHALGVRRFARRARFQACKRHRTKADPLEIDDAQTAVRAHAAHLPVAAFVQRHRERMRPIGVRADITCAERGFRPLGHRAARPDAIYFFDAERGMREHARELAVGRAEEHAGGIGVKPADRKVAR